MPAGGPHERNDGAWVRFVALFELVDEPQAIDKRRVPAFLIVLDVNRRGRSVEQTGKLPIDSGNLLPSLPVTGKLSIGFAAAVDSIDANGDLNLRAGYLDAEIVNSASARFNFDRIAFHAECARRGTTAKNWTGDIRFAGRSLKRMPRRHKSCASAPRFSLTPPFPL